MSRDKRTARIFLDHIERALIVEQAGALDEIGCTVGEEDVRSWTAEQRSLASEWCEAIHFEAEVAPPRPEFLAEYDSRRCRRCGCTQERACPGGCSWHSADVCSSCVAPGTLVDLRYFLERRPWVRLTELDGTARVVRFDRFGDGGLWFRETHSSALPFAPKVTLGSVRNHYLPVKCGIGTADRSETGLTFGPDGFGLTKFGKSIRVEYLPGSNWAQSEEGGE